MFELISEIESAKVFATYKGEELVAKEAITFPIVIWEDVVEKYFKIINELQLTPVFDWLKWKEGEEILKKNNKNFDKLNTITLCKLITVIIPKDRLAEGFIIQNFENGTILKILNSLQKHV